MDSTSFYFAEFNTYQDDPKVLGFQLAKPLKFYQTWKICSDKSPCSIPGFESLGSFPRLDWGPHSFLGYAVGNIDNDEALDVWIVTHKNRNPQNLYSDLENAVNPHLREILGLR